MGEAGEEETLLTAGSWETMPKSQKEGEGVPQEAIEQVEEGEQEEVQLEEGEHEGENEESEQEEGVQEEGEQEESEQEEGEQEEGEHEESEHEDGEQQEGEQEEGEHEKGDATTAAAPKEDAEPEAVLHEKIPVKPSRALTAWAIFLSEKHANKPSKAAGEAWRALGEEEKAGYEERASADKARFQKEMSTYKSWLSVHPEFDEVKPARDAEVLEAGTAYLPQARVRKLIKLNSEVKSISKEGLFTVTKAAEHFLAMISTQTVTAARKSKRKTTVLADFGQVLYGVRNADLLEFCHEDFPSELLMAPPKARKSTEQSKASKGARVGTADADAEKDGVADGAFQEEVMQLLDALEDGDIAVRERVWEDVKKPAGGKRVRATAKDKAEVPVQSTSMHDFFRKRTREEEAAAAAAAAAATSEAAAVQRSANAREAPGKGSGSPEKASMIPPTASGRAGAKGGRGDSRSSTTVGGTNILAAFAFGVEQQKVARQNLEQKKADEDANMELEDVGDGAGRKRTADMLAMEEVEDVDETETRAGVVRRRRAIVSDSDDEE
ncbi:hypothetical protein AB1Y20_000388 [Prymnesium parvum]|uniref:HMG box domain-containing protein n=1 Tax=Prymnesium parvum TaxID=97485 RepID=A0AB34K577_PRYPA